MTASRADVFRHAAAAGVLAAVLTVGSPARAQTELPAPEPLSESQGLEVPQSLDAPLDLAPPGGLTGEGAQPVRSGNAAPAPPEGATPAFGGVSEGEAVQVQTLRAVGADSTGTMTEAQGGFGDAMWRGSDRQVVEELIARQGVPTGPAASDLLRRILLSAASVPAGDGQAGSFLETRVRALARAGRMADVDALVGGVAPGLKTQVTKRIEVDALLLAGDDARACTIAVTEQTADPNPYWTRILAYCQMLGGQSAEAELAVSLLRETGDSPPGFEALFQAMQAGQPVNVPALEDLSALQIAMIRTLGAGVAEGWTLPPVPAFWPALAHTASLPDALRAEACEAALTFGLIDRDAAKAVADTFVFDSAAVSGALTGAEIVGGALGRALLLRAAEGQTVATARAELIAKAWQLADSAAARTATARLFLPVIRNLPGSSELVWFAEYGLRAAISAHDSQAGARWLQMMAAGAVFRDDMKAALDRVLPLARLARVPGSDRWAAESFAAWRAAAEAAGVSLADQIWMLTALGASGERLAPADWTIAFSDGPESDTTGAYPGSGVLATVMAAGGQSRIGETATAALAVFGETRGTPAAGAAFAVSQALSQAGLDAEARALLLDAALGLGL